MFSSDKWFGSGDFYNGVATQSLRFTSENSAWITLDNAGSATSTQICTLSTWFRKTRFSTLGYLFHSKRDDSYSSGNGATFAITMDADDGISVTQYNGNPSFGADQYDFGVKISGRKFRDSSSWYHLVVAIDTTQGSGTTNEADRIKMYINGVQQTVVAINDGSGSQDFADENQIVAAFQDGEQRWGATVDDGTEFSGYLAETIGVDGLQLDPSYFGEFKNGVWIAREPEISEYGNHGYRLQYLQTGTGSGSSSTLGADTSGKGNHFTSSGLYLQDSNMPDSPENVFPIMNPLVNTSGSTQTDIRDGGLLIAKSGLTYSYYQATMAVKTGKWYWEVRPSSTINTHMLGITNQNMDHYYTGENNDPHLTAGTAWYGEGGYGYFDGSSVSASSFSSSTSFASGNIIGIALDLDSSPQTVKWYKDGSLVVTKNLTSNFDDHIVPAYNFYNTNSAFINFGQDDTFSGNYGSHATNTDGNGRGLFRQSVPSGYLALCSANMTDETHATLGPSQPEQADDYFETVIYDGTGSSQSISGLKFKPDWTWIKKRSGGSVRNAILTDSSRGVTVCLSSSLADGDFTNAQGLTAFNAPSAAGASDGGFTVGSYDSVNESGSSDKYVAWNWKLNGGTQASTGNGTLTHTAQASPESGVSIILYTGGGSAGDTIGHGLNSAPEQVWFKRRGTSGNWMNYVKAMGGDGYINLDRNNGKDTGGSPVNNVDPSSTVITLGSFQSLNSGGGDADDTYIAYAFHSVEGFSKCGHYFGNSLADGAFVYTGFTPKWVLIKNTARSADWRLSDTIRQPINDDGGHILLPNSSSHEVTSEYDVDFLSNGFKLRSGDVYENGSAEKIIYLAFAENPFKYANAR